MVYSDFNKPSENMNISQRQIVDMIREQQEELYKQEEDKLLAEQAKIDRERESNANYYQEYVESQINSINNRAQFLESVKNSFLSETICKLFRESFGVMTKRDQIVARNLVNNFIKEQGAGDLLNRFKYQNTTVAEMGRLVDKYYGLVVESISKNDEDEANIPGRAKELHLDKTISDDFYKDLVELDTSEASKLIKDKVADAMSEFIDQNTQNRLDYEEVINTAKEKMADVKEESVIEETMNEAKRQINEMKRRRHKSIFQYVVEAISKEAFKDQNGVGKQYIHEASMDMDEVVESARLIYTMLEMLNTTEMVDQDYIKTYIENLVEV